MDNIEFKAKVHKIFTHKYQGDINKLDTKIKYFFEDCAPEIGLYYADLKGIENEIDKLKIKISDSKFISHLVREDFLSMLDLISAKLNILISGSKNSYILPPKDAGCYQ